VCQCSSILGSLPPPRGLQSCHRRFFLKKHAPGFPEHAFCDVLYFFSDFRGGPGKIFKIWSVCSNDYASKTRIEILCKKTCYLAPIFFLSLICYAIPANIEPRPERQPEQLIKHHVNTYPRSIGLMKCHVKKLSRHRSGYFFI